MNIDGEWRDRLHRREAPELDYGTAPMPVDDAQPDLYGSGYINGTIIGIPKQGRKHKEQAWALRQVPDDRRRTPLAQLSNGLRNVPSTKTSVKSPELKPDEHFATFLDDLRATRTRARRPITAVGRRLPGPRPELRHEVAGGQRAGPRRPA